MKIFFRIIVILLVSTLVGGGLSLIVENTSLFADTNGPQNLEQQPASSDGSQAQPPVRLEGGSDESAGSISRGLSEVLGSLVKISAITFGIVMVHSLLAWLRRRTLKLAHRAYPAA